MHTQWTDNTAADDDAYHDSPSLSPSERLENPLAPKKRSFTLHDAISTVRKTLATVLPRAARHPALGSLLHKVLTEYNQSSFFLKQKKDVVRASLKYLEVKLFA